MVYRFKNIDMSIIFSIDNSFDKLSIHRVKPMHILNRIYSLYALILFAILFLLLLPFFLILMMSSDRHPWLYKLNRLWAKLFFTLIFMPVKVVLEAPLSSGQQYIFCANHFSYLDIPILGYIPIPAVFIGKSSLAKVPVFGFMFRKIHIPVDRSNLRSKYQVLELSQDVLSRGLSLIIFPEGGILSSQPPQMNKFKDGAFRTAIEQQKPIVPITIPYNWIILRDDGKFILRWNRAVVKFHKPIETVGMNLDELDKLKAKVFAIIDSELADYNSNEN